MWETGQTTSYAPGDDGETQKGIDWPDPRFKDNGDGTVTDNLTGLMWLKDANCFGDIYHNNVTWQGALGAANGFNADSAGYNCQEYAADYSDWRVPNRIELFSLIDRSVFSPALPLGNPFVNVHPHDYWSSTTAVWGGDLQGATVIFMSDGVFYAVPKTSRHAHVWLVRGGQ